MNMTKVICRDLLEKFEEKTVTTKQILDYYQMNPEMYCVLLVETSKKAKALKLDDEIDLDTANTLVIIPKLAGGQD